MERDKESSIKNDSQNALNVVVDKIEETRARVHGDTSRNSIQPLHVPSLVSSRGSEFEDSYHEINESDTPSNSSKKSKNSAKGRTAHSKNLSRTELRPDCLNSESDGDETLGLSEDAKWIRRHFKKPLAIALRCMLIHRPRDPVDYLGKWLLNYQKIQEQMRIRENFICELMEQRRIIKENDFKSAPKYSEDGYEQISKAGTTGEEEIQDNNFQNYENP